MAGIRISSNNFNGKSVEITFNPFSGGTINLGTQTIPYDYVSSNYEGNYSIYIPEFDKTCPLQVGTPPSPTPSATSSPTPSITPTMTPTPSASVPSIDPDAAAYLADVIASGGTTNATISAATDTLFTSLKSNGLYSKMYAMYPYVGATAASHAINALGNKTYDITWNGGVTHGISGSTGNGSNGYGDTGFNNNNWAQDDISFGIYVVTENTTGGNENMFGYSEDGFLPAAQIAPGSGAGSVSYFRLGTRDGAQTSTGGTYKGNYIATRTGSTASYLYKNTNLYITNTNTYTKDASGKNVYVLAIRTGTTTFFGPSVDTTAFTFMGEGLSVSEVSTLDGIINTFQTSLGRNTY